MTKHKRTALTPRVVPVLTAEEAVSKAFAHVDSAALVTSDPEIMGGTPVFAGTRVPVEIVLASAVAGAGMNQLRAAYSFLTDAHLAAARVYTEANPRLGRPRRLSEANPD